MTVYYVDIGSIGGTCSDTNAGTDINNPWCSMAKANSTLVGGDTVYVRAGTYESINPDNNGSIGNRITYEAYNGETVEIAGSDPYDSSYGDMALVNKSYISIIGINFVKPPHTHINRWFTFYNVDHILMKDCDCTGGDETFRYSMAHVTDMTYSVFDNCSWDASDTDENSDSQNDLVNILDTGSHNLFINCDVGNVSHGSFGYKTSGGYVVFHQCTFHNKWRHGLSVRFGKSLVNECTFRNIATDCATCPYFYDRCTNHRTIASLYTLAYDKSICRNNTFYDCNWPINLSGQFNDTVNNWIYNNTVYDSTQHGGNEGYDGISFNGRNGGTTYLTVIHDNHIINNIFNKTEHNQQLIAYNYTYPELNPVDNILSHNIVYDSDSDEIRWGPKIGTLAYIEANHADWVLGTNIHADPMFVDPDAATPDFNLQSGSPAINAGRHMTLANGSGSGSTALVCDDVYWAFSGPNPPWLIDYPGIVADVIYFQQSDSSWVERTVMDINYTTKTITLDSAATWDNNTEIYYKKFNGTAPDLGAYESSDSGGSSNRVRTRGIPGMGLNGRQSW